MKLKFLVFPSIIFLLTPVLAVAGPKTFAGENWLAVHEEKEKNLEDKKTEFLELEKIRQLNSGTSDTNNQDHS